MKPEMLKLILNKNLDLVEAGRLVKKLVDSGESEEGIKTWLRLLMKVDLVQYESALALAEIFFEKGETELDLIPA